MTTRQPDVVAGTQLSDVDNFDIRGSCSAGDATALRSMVSDLQSGAGEGRENAASVSVQVKLEHFVEVAIGAREGKSGDLAGVKDFAGTPGIESFGEETLGDLGGDELDGVGVSDERDGDIGAGGANGVAITAVLDAEILAGTGVLTARQAADGEIAAGAPAGTDDAGGPGCGGRGGGH
jgi:hypothetical protein